MSNLVGRSRELNEKQARFADEYLVDLNATKAAVRAGYSAKTAYSIGQRLLKNVEVQEAIAKAMACRAERTGVTQDRVLEELALIAFADIGEAIRVDVDGRVVIRDLDTLRPAVRRAIGKISQRTTESHTVTGEGPDASPTVVEKVQLSIEHHSKVEALKLLMAHLGMNAPKKHELVGKTWAEFMVEEGG